MIDVIHWCLELGVPAISVYAFSIDNFKRSADEVGSLMQLAEEKYCELAKVGPQGLHGQHTVYVKYETFPPSAAPGEGLLLQCHI